MCAFSIHLRLKCTKFNFGYQVSASHPTEWCSLADFRDMTQEGREYKEGKRRKGGKRKETEDRKESTKRKGWGTCARQFWTKFTPLKVHLKRWKQWQTWICAILYYLLMVFCVKLIILWSECFFRWNQSKDSNATVGQSVYYASSMHKIICAASGNKYINC